MDLHQRVAHYVLSLPERALRAASAVAGGLLREATELTLPEGFRRTRLYSNLVEGTLRFLIEQVGEVRDAYPAEGSLSGDFAVRRAAGNGIEWFGILAFRASPVWVMAALADLSGAGRELMGRIAASLQEEGLLPAGESFHSMEAILEGLERTSAHLAGAINSPPLDVAGLRQEWETVRRNASTIPLPSPDAIREGWSAIEAEAARQQRSVFAVSSLMAMTTVRSVPARLWMLSKAAQWGAVHAGGMLAGEVLGHYRTQVREMGKRVSWPIGRGS